MACQGWYADTLVYRRQLDFTNLAESWERIPRHYVRRISFVSTILEDQFGADDVVKLLSAQDQDLLRWQARTENLQNDAEVRENLIHLSGRLCPYKNISFTLCSKVTDRDSHHQPSTERHPLSAYRHVSFRCAMLTDYSTSDGQAHLLFSYDGLQDREFLRWRSHDHIKLVLQEPRDSYRVFSLVQWDIVDKLDPISDGHAATTGPGIMKWSPRLDHVDVDSQGDPTEKVPTFHGTRVRREAKRKPRYVAEVRPKGSRGSRGKIWLGSYSTREAAARAADAGHYYYNHQGRVENRFNFLDSQLYLKQIPRDLNDKGMKDFVQEEAHRLASIPPPGWVSENQAYNTGWAQGFSSPQPPKICCGHYNCSSSRKQLPPNGNFVEALPRLDNFSAPLMSSGRDPQKNLPSTSYRTDVLREVTGSSSDENLWLRTSNVSFTDTSHLSAGVLSPGSDQTDVCGPSLPPAVNMLSYSDISNEISWGGLYDANDSGLHHETESQTAFQGFGSSLQGAESEWTCDDSYLIGLFLK